MIGLWDFLKERMLQNPDQQVCENDASMSFEEMAVWAETFAERLKGKKCCAILCSSEMAASMALLACFAAGVTAVPLSMRYGAVHCNKILDTISPDAIIMDEGNEIKVTSITDHRYQVPDEHPALIMCTSGTTGKPKGAMLGEHSIIANVEDIAEYFAIDKTDTILISRPLYHCAVLTGEFLTALVKGCKIRFYSEKFNPPKMLELICSYGITAFCGTPTLLNLMARFKRKTDINTLKHICVSGECMSKDIGLRIADAFSGTDIYHVYGLTEACPRVSYLPPKLFNNHPDCVGYTLRSVSMKILNQRGERCKAEEPGILWISGENIMNGYYNDPERTAKVLKDGWLCTGDVAILTASGLLKIKGRNDDLIIKAGMNIYPAEVEAAMKQDSRTKEVLVYRYEDRIGVQIGMKIVGDYSSVDEVFALCTEVLADFQRPNKIEILPELPKNGSGKIIRRA